MRGSLKATGLFVAAVVCGLTALGIERFVFDTSILAEGEPEWSARHLLKTALAVVGSVFFVASIHVLPRVRETGAGWSAWGHVSWTTGDDHGRTVFRLPFLELVAWGAYGMSVAFVLLFLWKPLLFNKLSREGSGAETLSALLCFVAAGVFAVAAFHVRRLGGGKLPLVAALGLAAVIFVIGGEEVSWFQRVLSLETPEMFEANMQREMNLHNFATDPIENLYYGATFLFLVVLPFARDRIPGAWIPRGLERFVPGVPVMAAAAFAAPYNYDMWNGYLTQVAFFSTTLILVLVLWRRGSSPVLVTVPLAIAGTQAIFLVLGHRFVRDWDVTEYKELFIPLGFAIYAIEVLVSAIRQRRRAL